MKKLMFILLMTLISFGISAQEVSIGDTIILKSGGRLWDQPPPEISTIMSFLKNDAKVTLLKEAKYGYYQIITENKGVGYINEIWFELSGYTKPNYIKPRLLTPMERTKKIYGNPDDISEYKSNGYHSITYTYYCAKGRYRSITYVKKSYGWRRDSEHTSNCID